MQNFEKFSFSCQDGYPLSARFYPSSAQQHRYPILIAPATGITQGFYHAFAQWLNQQGYAVMVFDFRGIGESLYEPLAQSKASILDWGQLDLPAAVQALVLKTAAEQVILIGHSAGSQLLGVMPNHHQVAKLIAIAGSTGYVKGLKGRTRLLAPFMFKVVFPISCLVKGYGTTQAIGMGENLPPNVAKQWAKFCSQPGYIINAQLQSEQDFHHEVRTPIQCIFASDDEIATAQNVNDLIRLYPNAATQMLQLDPKAHAQQKIGHMLMFKRSHQNLWPLIAQHLAV